MNLMKTNSCKNKGQTAVEYMILFGVVVAIVLVGFKKHLPKAGISSELYFNRTSNALMGKPNPCGDGICDTSSKVREELYCCVDCGTVGPDCF